ncbi:hypothetical protein C2S52_020817 [Perilla frutescens var. hirtella]|nr:hypothetical protein C2S52_020817 [Perilla frutescens var. hirtella]
MSFFINYNVEDILKQASESTLRYERGEPISVLDAVPIAIKDEIDCMPYPTTGGTKWMHKVRKCTSDACCVSRLIRLCGAIIVGKTNMHELVAGISGINPHYGAAKNPYNRSKITGGSSSGSAAVVAAGLCPVALGVDGGGSVRLPAALCGVVSFKPTFFLHAVLPIDYTVGMIGILAATVEDALIAYAVIHGGHPSENLAIQWLDSPTRINLIQEIVCSNPLTLEKINHQPKVGLPLLKSANYMSTEIKIARYAKLDRDIDHTGLLNGTRIGKKSGGMFEQRQLKFHEKVFSLADVIVTPTVGVTAYTIQDDALKNGELDYINGAALVRYHIARNFLGFPAVTIPVGYYESGLPIGLQFIGKPWSEFLLLYIASAMQDRSDMLAKE